MKEKLKEAESLIECLAAILICALSSVLLISAVMAGERMVGISEKNMTEIHKQISDLENLIANETTPGDAVCIPENINLIWDNHVQKTLPISYYRYPDSGISAFSDGSIQKKGENAGARYAPGEKKNVENV